MNKGSNSVLIKHSVLYGNLAFVLIVSRKQKYSVLLYIELPFNLVSEGESMFVCVIFTDVLLISININ
jgi:hypothetical protein